jgi:phenylpyruvate tautomerase PptA (4-oxalocrotonate tautomerase family)
MPLVKLHVSSGCVFSRKALAREVRLAVVEVLGIAPDHGHVVLYESPLFSRSTHKSRSGDFIFVEILMFSGRTGAMKELLFRRLNDVIGGRTGVPERDILFVVTEADRDNWAARGGVPISRLDIGY